MVDETSERVLQALIAAKLAAGGCTIYADSLRWLESRVLTQVLEHTEGNQREAARLLGITRGSLRYKLKALGITVSRTIRLIDTAKRDSSQPRLLQ
jgi:two-component system nitrogen regulation response regulator GlnG